MATVEKTKEQPKKFPVQEDLSDGEDYDSADDYTDDYTDEEYDEVPQTKTQKNKQLQKKPLQKQKQKQPVQDDSDDYTDEDDYGSDEYEYSDDEAVQPYSNENSNFKPSGGMDVLHKEEKSMLDEEGMKLRLELNLEIEVELKARIHGDLTLALIRGPGLGIFYSPVVLPTLTLYLVFCTRSKSQLFYLSHTSPIQLTLHTLNTTVTMSSKDFIIKHMNADHQDSLILFLQAYCGITSTQAKNAQLEELSTSNLIITSQGTRYSVPIEPVMKDYSEARGRMVAMHKESLKRLGRSEVTLTEYRAPRGIEAVIFVLCLLFYVTCFQRSNLQPGSDLYEYLGLQRIPWFPRIVCILHPYVVAIHIVETIALAVTQLKPLNVPALSGLWWKWVASCFVEGYGSFKRIRQIVKEQKAKNGKSQ
ncbi:unnamed protein product [Penicillium nalgiovense]|nr:unnamed protein product [Penicillium nalgiovense]